MGARTMTMEEANCIAQKRIAELEAKVADRDMRNYRMSKTVFKQQAQIERLEAQADIDRDFIQQYQVQVERLEKALTIIRDDPYCDAEMIIKVALKPLEGKQDDGLV